MIFIVISLLFPFPLLSITSLTSCPSLSNALYALASSPFADHRLGCKVVFLLYDLHFHASSFWTIRGAASKCLLQESTRTTVCLESCSCQTQFFFLGLLFQKFDICASFVYFLLYNEVIFFYDRSITNLKCSVLRSIPVRIFRHFGVLTVAASRKRAYPSPRRFTFVCPVDIVSHVPSRRVKPLGLWIT